MHIHASVIPPPPPPPLTKGPMSGGALCRSRYSTPFLFLQSSKTKTTITNTNTTQNTINTTNTTTTTNTITNKKPPPSLPPPPSIPTPTTIYLRQENFSILAHAF